MKKILILSVAVAAMLFTACGPKEEEIVNSSAPPRQIHPRLRQSHRAESVMV